jgi:hypothetical protein
VVGGTAIVSGTVTNGGTLFASAAGDLVEIASGAVVNGGVALIGNGIVDIAGSSGESVKFLSNGIGGLRIADTSGHTSAFSGRVSGFGGFGILEPRAVHGPRFSHFHPQHDQLELPLRRISHQRHLVRVQRRRNSGGDQHGRQLFGG